MRTILRPTLRVLAVTAMTVALALGPATRAQSASPEPAFGSFCALITADEATAALGVPVTPSGGSAFDCEWAADEATGEFTTLFVSVEPGAIADIKDTFSGGTDLIISGNPAYHFSPDSYTRQLWMEMGDFHLAFQIVDYHTDDPSLDVEPVMTALATIAAGLFGSMSLPALGNQGLADLFPDEIGGIPVDVTSLSGQQVLAGAGGPDADAPITRITEALTSMGKTIDDLGLGYTTVVDNATGAFALVVALQVRGADAATLAPLVMPLFTSAFLTTFSDPQEAVTQVDGRDVIMVTDGPPADTRNKAYVYPKDDVVWLVVADGTGITVEDVLSTLP